MGPLGEPRPKLTLRIHVRILAEPLHLTIREMVEAAQRVLAVAGIGVVVASSARLDVPGLWTIDVGECVEGELTDDQLRLFAEREGVPPGEVVIYFVPRTIEPVNGCAAYPDGMPGALITRTATRWTLAHELGHVLGLEHVDDTRRLMIGPTTTRLTRFPPELVQAEIEVIRRSPLLTPGR